MGDTVAVCAPAGPVPQVRLKKGLERLEARYRVRVDPGVLTRKGYLAGDDRRRADQLNEYLRDSDVRAVLLARGGYGLMRILDLLDADALLRDPKLLVGFSDATALLGWARNAAGVRCIHGPMVAQLGDLPHRDVEWLFRSMEDPRPFGRLPVAFSPVGAHNSVERVEGPLTGGNLCLLSHLVGTPYCPDFAGSVLAFEDVGERPYRIDRYLTHLGLAGLFDHIAGVLVGDLTDCEETTRHDHPRALAVVDERLCRYGVAGLCGVPFGHGKRNLALPLGARCAIDVRRGELHLVEAAVS
ncbi:MAG: LD-carboxypeptidase [Proteobacteria bacterium]|nr:LD-carboxypeptidase [Pseudomonadota bacterium]